MKLLSLTVFLLLFSPLSYSQEWVRQNPFATLSQMYDIDFDGPYGLAVGADAMIFTTTNGGTTWKQGTSFDSTKTLLSAFVVPGTSGQVMLGGGDDYLLMTENGGQFWKITYNYIPSPYKIQSLPGGIIMTLGSDFGLRTSDQGRFWQPFNMPGMGVTAGHFTSIQKGWVAYGPVNNQQVWVTTNGGTTWSVRDPLKHSVITSIDMINDQVGFLSSRDFIYKTTDGGYHWEPLHDIASEGGITDLHVVDEGSLWASLNDGSVYFSTSGVWNAVNPNVINNNKTLGIWATFEGKVWTVGKYLSILYSPNFGDDWSDQIPANKETMFEPSFFNEFIGMVGGSNGAILKTINSGAKWEKISFPSNESFNGLEMVDENVVVAGSTSGKVFLSDNQGATWTTIGQNLGKITDLKAFNRYEIIVTTEQGRIYKTSDSGVEWIPVYNNAADHLFGLYFFDHQSGWATGWKGKVLMTTNGGETWTPLYNDKRNTFSDVHFTSMSEGWAVSALLTDTVWHTFNGGQTWQKVLLPIKSNWRAVSFMNADIGWITGGSDGYGIVLRTDDGGNSWFVSHESPDALLGVFAIPGQETVWAVGFGGNIVKYASCASPPDIEGLTGAVQPCPGDTVTYVAQFSGVDYFNWTYPEDWIVLGTTNTSAINFIAGSLPGNITVQGSDACRDTTVGLSMSVTPVTIPEILITEDDGILVTNMTSGIFQWLLNGLPIQGANNFTHKPIVNGIYQLQFTTTPGCGTISNAFQVTLPVLQEAEWVRQNPFPDLSQMNDIDFDGAYGLAVGTDATILVTTNGGKTWVRQLPAQLAIDTNVSLQTAYVVPGTFGQVMLAGGGGLLLMTENGGQLWRISHDEIPSVYKIQSFPGGILMALGSDFGVFTTDNGIFWQPFNMPGFGVTAGHFLNTQTGWVAFGDFNNQQVWYTTDRGMNWNILDSLAHPIITSIDMVNDQVGFLSSRDFVYKTLDGGQQWLPLHSIASEGGITDLHVVDLNNLWASLNNGFVYFSTDGGTTWQEVNPNVINSNRTLGIWANTTGEVWMVGKYVSILHSPNFGVDWSDQFPAAKETMFEPNFYNEFVGMVGASDGTIMKTKNSGAIWEKITFPRNENFFGLTMVDENVVVAGSSSGKVFLTESQGDVWIVVGENLGQITDLFAFNRYEILVTTEGGKIYKTSDGGTQWDIVYDNPADLLTGIDFYDHQFGWATGWSGKILTTVDGGESWNTLWSEGINQFTDVQFNSATEGWFVSSSFTDTLWHTIDAGQTLLPSVLPVKTFWRAISFMNADTGWVTGGSNGYGVVLRTDDGGNSWYLSHESPDALMGIYAVPGQETVWAVGFGGNIVKYSSCSAPPDITELRGNLEPCAGDTVNFVVEFNGVDLFDWEFPSDWFVVGNSNTSSINFITGSTPGLVNVQGRNACGDTTVQLSVSVFPVIPPEVIISQDNGDLVANTSSGFFQWFLNGVPIPGAESSTYHPTVSGIYQLHLLTFTSGCETFSNELEVIITATHFSDSDQLMVYPNPAKDILYILYADGKSIPEGSKVTLTNVTGRTITSVLSGNDHITLQGMPPGIYSLQIESGLDIFIKKIMIE